MQRIRFRVVLQLLFSLSFAELPFVWSFAPAILRAPSVLRQRTLPVAFGTTACTTTALQSTFAADGSEYAADKSDVDSDDEYSEGSWNTPNLNDGGNAEDDTPTIELQPVPISKNAGNRFVAVIWDRQLQKDRSMDALDLHYSRIELTEEHVMFCRKQNLYNETFNTESMVDILWSLPLYVL